MRPLPPRPGGLAAARGVAVGVANAALVVSGLACIVVLGTSGTRVELPFASVGLRHIAPPFTFFCLAAALRLALGRRRSGLEGRIVAFHARLGLPPRDAPATAGSAARAGALLGAGLGFVVALTDIVRVVLATPPPGPPPGEGVAFVGLTLVTGLVVGGAAGAGAGTLTYTLPSGRAVGRYDAGRRAAALLIAILPAVAWLAPPLGDADADPAVLVAVAATALPAAALAFLVLPAAVLRARRGRWGVAVVVGAIAAVVLASAAIVAMAPPGLYITAQDSPYPNVLLVSLAGLRADVVGAYRGASTLTPVLAEIASRGGGFREVLSPSTGLPPAAASILTGLYPASHGLRAPGGRLRPGIESLPEVLARHGFRTGAFVATRRVGGREAGLAPLFARYDDPTWLVDWLRRTAVGSQVFRRADRQRRPPEETAAAFAEWVSALPRGPWFAWVQLADLQQPIPASPPEDLRDVGGLLLPRGGPPPAGADWARAADRERPLRDWVYGYARAVRAADRELRALAAAVEARGDLHRTLIVVVAEAGTPLGEDAGWFGAPRGLEEEVMLVPWIVVGPGIGRGTWVEGPCSLVDVSPTVLGLVGIKGRHAGEGEDLSRYLLVPGLAPRDPRSGPVFAEHVAEDGTLAARSVRYGRFKLLRDPPRGETLHLVVDGADRELPAPRGREERQLQQLSDMLARRELQEAM